MPECKNCGNLFPNWIEINGSNHNLGSRKFCLECSPFGKHNTRNIARQKEGVGDAVEKCLCDICGKEYVYERKKGHTKKRCNCCMKKQSNTAQRQIEVSRRRKLKLVLMMGGSCQICGYNKNFAALAFHHTDPSQKSFGLDGRTLANNSWETIIAEANKCVLLCHNCHSEAHHPTCQIDDIQNPNGDALQIQEKPKPLANFCCDCGASVSSSKTDRCSKCQNQNVEKISWPPTEELLKELEATSYLALGRKLGVSDNAIRKRIKNHPPKTY